MKAIFVGGGTGCRDVLELFIQGQLDILDLEILAVVDVNPDAPGMLFARQRGWPTLTDLEKALALEGLELIIELTGSEDALDKIFFNMPPGVRVMDHVMARVFWDLEKLTQTIRQQLREKTALETRIVKDRAELQEILDNLPDSVMVIDKDRTILRVNRRFEEVSGKRRENVEGLACRDACIFAGCGNTCEGFPGPFQTVLHTTKQVKRDGPDGEIFEEEDKYYQMTVKPILDEKGEVSRVVRTSREVTQQVRLKQETEEWARHFDQLVQAVHGIITIKDLDGRYTLVNPRVLEISGLRENELLGCTARELFDAEAARVIEGNDQRALEGGGYYATEERVVVGGKERIFFSERFPLTDYRVSHHQHRPGGAASRRHGLHCQAVHPSGAAGPGEPGPAARRGHRGGRTRGGETWSRFGGAGAVVPGNGGRCENVPSPAFLGLVLPGLYGEGGDPALVF